MIYVGFYHKKLNRRNILRAPTIIIKVSKPSLFSIKLRTRDPNQNIKNPITGIEWIYNIDSNETKKYVH